MDYFRRFLTKYLKLDYSLRGVSKRPTCIPISIANLEFKKHLKFMDNLFDENQLFSNNVDLYFNQPHSPSLNAYPDCQTKDANLFHDFEFNFNHSNDDSSTYDSLSQPIGSNANFDQPSHAPFDGLSELRPPNDRDDGQRSTSQYDQNESNRFAPIVTCNEVNLDKLNHSNESYDDSNDELKEFDDLDVQTLKNFFYSENNESLINQYLSDPLNGTDGGFELSNSIRPFDHHQQPQIAESPNLEQTSLLDEFENAKVAKNVFSLDEYNIEQESVGDFVFDCSSEMKTRTNPITQIKKTFKCALCKYSSPDRSKVRAFIDDL